MSNQLTSQMVPLGKLFSQEFFFRIPEYQRPFLWDTEHFTDLIDDLVTASQDEPYFLGTLVLHEASGHHYDVIDGQQRLTALCILFACLRDAPGLKGEEDFVSELHEKIVQPPRVLEKIHAKLRLQVRDQAAFNTLVQTKGGASTPFPSTTKATPSEYRYELARRIFWERLETMTREEIKSFATFVTQQCSVIYLATASFEDAFRLFTVVNDRGKQLRRIDVLKAYNLSPEHVPNESARSKYAHQWEAMENRLGEGKFEEILHLLRLIYLKDKPQGDLHKEFTKRVFPQAHTPTAGAHFMDELEKYVDLYDSLFIARDILDDDSTQTRDAHFHTIMEAMDRYFGASEWKACLLSFARKFGTEKLYHFLLTLEKVYLDHWVQGVRKDERYGVYTEILHRISDETSADAVLDATKVDLQAIQLACRSDKFYGASHAKYLLVRAEIVASELDEPRHFQVRSIEHVLPQNPDVKSDWAKLFSLKDREELVDSVGNLVLLSKSKNSSAGRREFSAKKTTYLKPRVSDYPRSMQVLDYPSWTPEVVRERIENFVATVLNDPK